MAASKKGGVSEWVWGKQAVLELLKTHPRQVTEVIMASSEQDPLRKAIYDLSVKEGVPVIFKERRLIDQIVSAPAHQSVIARLKDPSPFIPLETLMAEVSRNQTQPPVLVAVDHIQDPQNLGAMIRTAHCAGVRGMILPRDRSCPISGTVRKAAAGALEHMPLVEVTNLVRSLEMLKEKGFWVLSLEADSPTSVYSLDLRLPLVVVVGGESKGVGSLIKKHSDWLASIPMEGRVSSLNASVACAVVLYEILRQRLPRLSA